MGNDLVQNTQYEDFSSLLLQQYQEKPNFLSVIRSCLDQANDIEQGIIEVRDEFYLSSSVGDQLDIIGQIIGLDRNGRDDDSYRTLLEIKAEINITAGTPESLIKTAVALYNATKVEYKPRYPAKVQLWSNGDIGLYLFYDMELDDTGLLELDNGDILELQQADDIAEDLLYQILPAGVGLLLADNLILDDNGYLYLDDGGFLITTEE